MADRPYRLQEKEKRETEFRSIPKRSLLGINKNGVWVANAASRGISKKRTRIASGWVFDESAPRSFEKKDWKRARGNWSGNVDYPDSRGVVRGEG